MLQTHLASLVHYSKSVAAETGAASWYHDNLLKKGLESLGPAGFETSKFTDISWVVEEVYFSE